MVITVPGAPPTGEMHIGKGQPGLPVMGMHDVGPVAGQCTHGDVGGYTRQGCEAPPIIRPVTPVRPGIGISGSTEKMRRVERQNIQPCCLASDQLGRPAEELGECAQSFSLGQRCHDRRITGDYRTNFNVFVRQGSRQGAHDVG